MAKINLLEEEGFCSIDMTGNSQRLSILLAKLAVKNPELKNEIPQAKKPGQLKCELDDFIKIVKASPFYEYEPDEFQENREFCERISPDFELARMYGMFESVFVRDYNNYRTKGDRRLKVKFISRAAASLRMVEALFAEGKSRGIILKRNFI